MHTRPPSYSPSPEKKVTFGGASLMQDELKRSVSTTTESLNPWAQSALDAEADTSLGSSKFPVGANTDDDVFGDDLGKSNNDPSGRVESVAFDVPKTHTTTTSPTGGGAAIRQDWRSARGGLFAGSRYASSKPFRHEKNQNREIFTDQHHCSSAHEASHFWRNIRQSSIEKRQHQRVFWEDAAQQQKIRRPECLRADRLCLCCKVSIALDNVASQPVKLTKHQPASGEGRQGPRGCRHKGVQQVRYGVCQDPPRRKEHALCVLPIHG